MGEAVDKEEIRHMDYEVLEDIRCLEKEEIVIYGAGYYGVQAAEMLHGLGYERFVFCDSDISRHGKIFMGKKIISIKELEEMGNCLVIIAIYDERSRKEIERILQCFSGIHFLSFFSLERVWAYTVKDYTTIEYEAEEFFRWHRHLSGMGENIKRVCKSPLLVYQYGKVGSSTVSVSLRKAGIINAQFHSFFLGSDLRRELPFVNEIPEFIKNHDFLCSKSPAYVKKIRDNIRSKKIITLVRDPIAVDLASVFQRMEALDKRIVEWMKSGNSFTEAVAGLAVEMKGGLFDWFDKELKVVCDVDVLAYPFDKEKGYTIIKNDTVEILLVKTEKLSQMTKVLRDFTGNQELELLDTNMGKDKEYSHIYEEVKKRIKFPKEYAEYYYKGNPYMEHFYSKQEINGFYDRWMGRSQRYGGRK